MRDGGIGRLHDNIMTCNYIIQKEALLIGIDSYVDAYMGMG